MTTLSDGGSYGIYRHFQQYFSYILEDIVICGGSWSTR